MPQDLSPCPFCGKAHTLKLTSAEELAREGDDFDDAIWPHSDSWAVMCDASRPDGPGGCGASGGFFPTEAEAVQAWNRRTALEAQAAEIARLTAERDKLKTVMIAAAEEIAAHWDAHCDADGYGPVNLQRRLEEGIPSEYGYTAGAFAALRAERDGLLMDAERYRWLRSNQVPTGRDCPAAYMMETRGPLLIEGELDAAIDAAREST